MKARLIKMGHLNSMNIFLRQEIDRMQKVISILRSSLSDLKLAIEGTIIMSEVDISLFLLLALFFVFFGFFACVYLCMHMFICVWLYFVCVCVRKRDVKGRGQH